MVLSPNSYYLKTQHMLVETKKKYFYPNFLEKQQAPQLFRYVGDHS